MHHYCWFGGKREVSCFSLLLFLAACFSIEAQNATETRKLWLSGTDKDHRVDWDFFCSEGRNSKKWTKIPVPSCWEMEGFGTLEYGRLKKTASEFGRYKHSFFTPLNLKKGEKVFLIFEGAFTDTEVKLNGRSLGPIHQGGFYEFKYEISSLLNPSGKSNLLEVTCYKVSKDSSVNKAERDGDFWVFGGLFRPVYLEVLPEQHIEHLAIDAKHTGDLNLWVFPKNLNIKKAYELEVLLDDKTLFTKIVGTKDLDSTGKWIFSHKVREFKSWSMEFPNLHKLSVKLKLEGKILHQVSEKIGFRTIELRPNSGVFLNNVPIKFKGVNRHSVWPISGRTTSEEVSVLDVKTIKQMNMNAVRMSHYPPDKHFLKVCDSLGLLVLNELTGWQKAYNTPIGRKLVKELVVRDVNHPSVVMWDNGNEGGHNLELVEEYAKYDIQKRPVIHPWSIFGGADTQHYKGMRCCVGSYFNGKEVFFPTEFLHGLYDGGGGAGLEDYWEAMWQNPLSAGGFIWAYVDDAVMDGDSLNSAGSLGPDGMVGPFREREGSFFTIKEVWSPVKIKWPVLKSGSHWRKPSLENRFHFTKISDLEFELQYLKVFRGGERVIRKNRLVPTADGGAFAFAELQNFPSNFNEVPEGTNALRISLRHPTMGIVMVWTKPIEIIDDFPNVSVNYSLVEKDSTLIVKGNDQIIVFSRANGRIKSWVKGEDVLPLCNGPLYNNGPNGVKGYKWEPKFGRLTILTNGLLKKLIYTFTQEGGLGIEYAYEASGNYPHMGIHFNWLESEMKQIEYLGFGPHRVYKNRLLGPQFGYFSNMYNDTRTGKDYVYPEFKGYFKDMNWFRLYGNRSGLEVKNLTQQNTYTRIGTPREGLREKWREGNIEVPYPNGDLSFLHSIPAIGDKFTKAENLTPSGALNEAFSEKSRPFYLEGKVYFKPFVGR